LSSAKAAFGQKLSQKRADLRREPSARASQQKYVDRVVVLEDALDMAAVEDFAVANDGARPITEVAHEILQRAGL
jgi:hypothetical protein